MKNFAIVLVISFITLFVGEMVTRMFVKLPDPYAHLRIRTKSTGDIIRLQNPRNDDFYFIFEPTEYYPKDEPNVIEISQNNYGFRHKEDIKDKKDEFRIFAIGGSTTQNYDYPYEKTWCNVLEKNLESTLKSPVKVYNGGTAGAALIDHLALLQNRVIHLQPDAVILFAGINDLNLLLGDNNLYRFPDLDSESESVSWYKLGLAKLTLYRLGLNAITKLKNNTSTKETENPRASINPTIEPGKRVLFTSHLRQIEATEKLPFGEFPSLNFEYYEKMVRSFIGICQSNNIKVLVMTQPTTWDSKDEKVQKSHWMNKGKEHRFDKVEMQKSMDHMNERVVKVCEERQVPCFKAENVLPKTNEFIYDDCHFTPKGSVVLGDSLSKFLISSKILETR